MLDKFMKHDKRSKRRVAFSSYAEIVLEGPKTKNEGIVENRYHMKGFITNSSEVGVLFTCTSQVKVVNNNSTGVLYIDPEISSEKIFTFLVKVRWANGEKMGLEFTGGDLDDIAEYKKLISVTGEIINEESNDNG